MSITTSGTSTPYDTKQEVTSTAMSNAAESGAGGGDMKIWTQSRVTILGTLCTAEYTNHSSHTLPGGVVDTARYSPFENGEVAASEPDSTASTGTGGGLMDVWYARRLPKLRALATRSFLNQSSFSVPAGVIGTSEYNAWDDNEVFLGHSVQGQAIAPNGLALEGTLKVLDGETGEELDGSVVSGTFIASFAPLGSALSGASTEDSIGSYDLSFEPTADGLGKTLTGAGYPEADYFDVTYGYLAGLITDREGTPLQGEIVRSGGVSTSTDGDGFYYLLVPGGTGVELTGLDGSQTKQATAQAGETTRTDWQYGGIEVKVTGPEGRPVKNAPVVIDGTKYRTDKTGVVSVETAGIGEHAITIMENFEDSVNVLAEGQLARTTYEGGARLEVTIYDPKTGEPIQNLPAIDLENSAVSFSDDSGMVSMLAPTNNNFRLRIGVNDPRYKTTELERGLTRGETASEEAVLERKTAIRNS